MKIVREEIFRPFLVVLPYTDEDDAVSIASDSIYRLAAYVFSENLPRARAIANRIRAGRVFINEGPTDAIAPFGGYKQFGNGREVGVFGLKDFLKAKAVLSYNETKVA
jgi:aldehyde dehydrogenase (NAD+)